MKNKTLLILILLLTASFFISTNISIAQTKSDTKLVEGIENYYKHEYKSAIDNFSSFLNSNIKENELYIDALYYQTLSYIKNKDITMALKRVEDLKNKGYEFGIIHWEIGKLYLNKDRLFDSAMFQEAKDELEKASMLGIDSPKLHSDLAKAYQGLNLHQKAIKEYEMAVEKGTNYEDHLNLANLYKKNKNDQKALKHYQKYLNFNKENVSVYSSIGDIYINNQEYDQAIKILNKGIKMNKNHFSIQFQLGRVYFKEKKYNKAQKKFERVIELDNDNYSAFYYLGKIDSINQNHDKAKYYFEQAIRFNPKYADAYIELGDIYLNEENIYKAISQYSSAVESNPEYPKSHFHLAKAFVKRGMKEAAISELRKTLHLSDNHKEAKELLEKLLEE